MLLGTSLSHVNFEMLKIKMCGCFQECMGLMLIETGALGGMSL
jgi:hypothetical protein